MDSIHISDREVAVPAQVRPIGTQDYYEVPLSIIHIAPAKDNIDPDDPCYWTNPRNLSKVGYSPEEMDSLADSIAREGLQNAIVCRWYLEDDELQIQVVEGERRLRTLRRLVDEDRMVFNGKEYAPASKVYEHITCRIKLLKNDEAFALAYAIDHHSVRWGDGAVVRLVRNMRNPKFTDERILGILGRSAPWLRQMDALNELDEVSYSHLVNNTINQSAALLLTRIPSVEDRHQCLHKALEDAVKEHQENVQEAQQEEARFGMLHATPLLP